MKDDLKEISINLACGLAISAAMILVTLVFAAVCKAFL